MKIEEPMHTVPTNRIAITLSLIAAVALYAGCAADQQAADSTAGWSVPSDSAIAAHLAERMQQNGVGLVVGVIDGERRSVVAHGVTGADQVPLNGATVFQLGSLTKVITTLLLADMVARGDLWAGSL